MKKQIISIISLLLISTEVIAQYCKINDIIYGLDSSNNTAFVTYDRAFNYYYSGDVNIPSDDSGEGNGSDAAVKVNNYSLWDDAW